ncbi:hypothetical protein TNCV_1875131 [Trichonephila clavipes]|nr:hypothetical protein TNCV_1875131 [Trichonephila clavipes]
MALYRSPLTVTLWPSSFLKKYGPMIPPVHKVHQTTSTVHNSLPIFQILDGASAVCQDPDTVLIRVESMIESTTNSNEFRSKDGTVVRIPDADFNIVPRSVIKNTTPCSTRIRTSTDYDYGLFYSFAME